MVQVSVYICKARNCWYGGVHFWFRFPCIFARPEIVGMVEYTFGSGFRVYLQGQKLLVWWSTLLVQVSVYICKARNCWYGGVHLRFRFPCIFARPEIVGMVEYILGSGFRVYLQGQKLLVWWSTS